MEKILDKKITIVTGGTSGIGEATALLFAKEGATVVVSGRREVEGTAVVEKITKLGGKGKFIQCDVSKEADVKNLISQTVATFGRLDIAVNNAGIEQFPLVPLTETSVDEFRKIFDINVFGVWLSMKYEIPELLKTGGAIVNTSSVAGHVGMVGASTYIASKHAVEGLTKSVALEFADKGIRINAVAPAGVETAMLDRFVGGMDKEKMDYFSSLHPMQRVGKVDEVAQAILFLASPRAGFSTGISLPVDGGWLSK